MNFLFNYGNPLNEETITSFLGFALFVIGLFFLIIALMKGDTGLNKTFWGKMSLPIVVISIAIAAYELFKIHLP